MNIELDLELERNKRTQVEAELRMIKAEHEQEFGIKLDNKSFLKHSFSKEEKAAAANKFGAKAKKVTAFQKGWEEVQAKIDSGGKRKNFWEPPVAVDNSGYFVIYTDGGTGEGYANNCLASWAFVAADKTEKSGIDTNSTCNRAELLAIIRGLEYAKSIDQLKVVIKTDSMLCVNCCSGKWKRKANIDYWALWERARQGLDVRYEWVKGHNGNPGNERADELCGIALYNYKMQND